MPSTTANGITIEYDLQGDPSSPPLLLIMGLGAQLIAWDDRFVAKLVERGFHVVRYDNRDVGLSTWFDGSPVPDLLTLLGGGGSAPYLLDDMADDAAALLDALGIESAHVVGASMGGMIAQAFAIRYPERTRTLVSIMSTTGDRNVGQPHPEALEMLTAAPPTERAAVIDQSVVATKTIGSPGYPFDEAEVRAHTAEAFDRAFHPAGTGRQLAAIVASPDRTPGLRGLKMPTLVIHGDADPLVDPSGGQATASAVPGAELKLLHGVGHDLPVALHDEVADDIAALARERL